MKTTAFWCAAICVAVGLGMMSASARADIEDVKVTTDRSIDCSSIQTIARDLYAGLKTDEEKAIATWYFVRRLHFHYPTIPTWDSVDLINSYGFALCGYQSNMFSQIGNAGGVKTRTMHLPGHVIAESYYGGAWHMFDCQVGWFAYRKDKSAVASCAEMKADPSIVIDAVKEGRASKPYFQCRDEASEGAGYTAKARAGAIRNPPDRKLVINLRRGESITRTWDNEGKSWFKAGQDKWVLPRHGCTAQGIDQDDPVNWPYWKPYATTRKNAAGKTVYATKRTYGNGRMVYKPNLASDAFADGLAGGGMEGVKARYQNAAGPNLRPAKAGQAGSVTFVIDSPYIAVDAWLDATGLRKSNDDVLTIYARKGKGKWVTVYSAETTGKVEMSKISLKEAAWASHRYFVKFELSAGASVADVGIDSFAITTVFMNNIQSLPQLMPGKNVVTLSGAKGADLKANKLTAEYVWQEEGKDKKVVRTVDVLPLKFTIDVPGKDRPRMKSLTLSVAP